MGKEVTVYDLIARKQELDCLDQYSAPDEILDKLIRESLDLFGEASVETQKLYLKYLEELDEVFDFTQWQKE
jgi:hypothetical protein